jgi:hypothetical protein
MLNDELISAYLDGELDAEKRDWVEDQLRTDRAAAARLERLSTADRLLKLAVPQVEHAGDDLLAAGILAQKPLESRAQPRLWATLGAVAATLILGVLVGRATDVGPPESPLALSAQHARLLDTTVSGEPVNTNAGVFEVVLSVQSEAGVCRQYRVSTGAESVDALACRRGEGWRMVAASANAVATGYVPAGGGSPTDAAVDALGSVSVIDLDQERELIARQWR